MQFDCGPQAKPLPSDEVLATWSSRDLLDEYRYAWNWGARCDGLLRKNEAYIKDSIATRERIIEDLKKPQ